MNILKIHNPFNAPVYHKETVSSTMNISRQLLSAGNPHGTVITADFQEAGRGRIKNRIWEMDKGINLPFTILLCYPRFEDIPAALTLRAGLALALAIENFAPSLLGKVFVKWPNDIMIVDKKTAGILCEAEQGYVFLGIGVNVAQKEFPAHLKKKATGIALAANIEKPDRFYLLEKILKHLFIELETKAGDNWKSRLEERLYKKGESVTFIDGIAGSGREITGCLTGITNTGELLILPQGETQPRLFITGELKNSYNLC
jgi:BirA family biotin operon repressor/biotin-[acetyl-CoA-carboxylase] ligase